MSPLLVLAVALTVVSAEYHKTWSVKVKRGTDPDLLAKQFNMINLGQVSIVLHFIF